MNPTNDRIEALRKAISEKGFDAIILPSNDPHQSEYVSDYWKIRAHFSGFTGSAGTLVISQDEAALWTDSRYFLQVEQQCSDSVVELHKQSIPHAPEHVEWICQSLQKGATIAVDFRLFSVQQMDHLKTCGNTNDITITDLGELINSVWEDRPAGPTGAIVDHSTEHCGESRGSKIQRVLETYDGIDYNFISSLDEVCWIYNIRSTDVDFTPLVTAYALISKGKSYFFTDIDRIESGLKESLASDNIEVHPYESVRTKLSELTKDSSLATSPTTLNYACASAIKGKLILRDSSVQHFKSIKNDTEINNAKDGMLKDGIALTQFFIWMEEHLQSNTISEFELGRKLESFRATKPLYKDQSFGCIVGYKSNGAIIHYSAPEVGSATISNEGVLLIDSGAQYENATTDITRTVWLGGTPSEDLKRAYTLVLKGYIELETLQFPKGTTGIQLDSFARMYLWKHGLNYGHGTGHGIGSYSMVHEPAQGFAASMVTFRGGTPHVENQFSTIEPGYYKEGEYGIRTENVVVSKEVQSTQHGSFLGFEAITVCPIEKELIDKSLMLEHEINWLNKYHQNVLTILLPHLNEAEGQWLKAKCAPVK